MGKLPCIFSDILQQVPANVDVASGDFASKKQRINQCCLAPNQQCMTHNKACSLNVPVDIDMSGLPCPDNSRANNKRKFEEGASGPIYITWAKHHRSNRTPLLILENVPEPCLHYVLVFSMLRRLPVVFAFVRTFGWPCCVIYSKRTTSSSS